MSRLVAFFALISFTGALLTEAVFGLASLFTGRQVLEIDFHADSRG